MNYVKTRLLQIIVASVMLTTMGGISAAAEDVELRDSSGLEQLLDAAQRGDENEVRALCNIFTPETLAIYGQFAVADGISEGRIGAVDIILSEVLPSAVVNCIVGAIERLLAENKPYEVNAFLDNLRISRHLTPNRMWELSTRLNQIYTPKDSYRSQIRDTIMQDLQSGNTQKVITLFSGLAFYEKILHGSYAVMEAASKGHREVVDAVLSMSVSCNVVPSIAGAIRRLVSDGQHDKVRVLLADACISKYLTQNRMQQLFCYSGLSKEHLTLMEVPAVIVEQVVQSMNMLLQPKHEEQKE